MNDLAALPTELLGEALNRLEDLEAPLLSWGVTTGALSVEELTDALEATVDAWCSAGGRTVEADDLLEELLRLGLLFQVPALSPRRYRTRVAETLRLATNLRQLFPPRDLDQPPARWWDQGRPLVADYRLHMAPRYYPKRNIPPEQVRAALNDLPSWTAVRSSIADAYIGTRQLSQFQLDSTLAISQLLHADDSRGLVIGAGTGAGKTLAFYLPTFAALSDGPHLNGQSPFALGLYPRKELLRDQVKEAVTAAITIRVALHAAGRRPIRIGALYGDTPYSARDRRLDAGGSLSSAWPSIGAGLRCPFLTCPVCDGDLIWPHDSRQKNEELLVCSQCACELPGTEFALTRESLRSRPPDLLFTTTEMLSQRSSDPQLGRLLGWFGGARPPRLVLLDEVHTYSGVQGAQVALLLRRWRNAVRSPVTFVGLSATLRDAASFFARLTGLQDVAVEYIEPRSDDLEAHGREYAIALRGDPVSGASLLSTSIQTAMLFGRVLDRRVDEQLFGSRGFLFTDDLDVTNRFYDDLRDAEGKQNRRTGVLRGKVLAGLRSPDAPFSSDRFRDGQSWDLVHKIGRTLDPKADGGALRVSRTSSQDAGVDVSSDLVVATASLEVGFNDPHVGLVIQHKAPIDTAAFIQRRGRAGRRTDMRPITVVTLSDYGRDRLAYQAYDEMFSPTLQARGLPVGNRYVLKIQAAQATLDWLGRKVAANGAPFDPRALLRAPKTPPAHASPETKRLTDLLEALLLRSDIQDDLARNLRYVLGISPDEVQALLWEPPRAVLTAVVPTALRRLRSGWQPEVQDPGAQPGDLLPEFVTRALFEPLNVPEIRFAIPFAEDERLPIAQALREAVPGRVSRRFGYRRDEHRTWLPLPDNGDDLELATIVLAGVKQGQWTTPAGDAVDVVRPFALQLAEPPREVADASQGRPIWLTEIVDSSSGIVEADRPYPDAWTGWLRRVGFATHVHGNPVELRRMTTGASCETRFTDGRVQARSARYTVEGRPAALGFQLSTDGLKFEAAPLKMDKASVKEYLASPSWRSTVFSTRLLEDPDLDGIANSFQRGWLTLVYLTAFTLAGLDRGVAPRIIVDDLRSGGWGTDLRTILGVLYREADASNPVASPERLMSALEDLVRDPVVQRVFDLHAALLADADIAQATSDLAQRCYADSLAAGVLSAVLRSSPDANERDLVVDMQPAKQGTSGAVWITETSLGGLGVIEQFTETYAEDPRRFWGLVRTSLGPSDYEYVDASLSGLLRHVVAEPDGGAALGFARFRRADSVTEAEAAMREILQAWTLLDGPPRHGARSCLSARVLRPGSSPATDSGLVAIIDAWDDLELRLGVEVDARVVAYAFAEGRLAATGSAAPLTADQTFSLLWPRGQASRNRHLQHYNPYAPASLIDRRIVGSANDEQARLIDVTQSGWQALYVEAVTLEGFADLGSPASNREALASALKAVQVLPVDIDVLRLYGVVRRYERHGGQLLVRVELREALQ